MEPATLALLRYSTQILLVVCIAAVAAALTRLSVPVARLAYRRAVAALCLALPFLAATGADAPAVSVAFGPSPAGAARGPAAQALMTVGTAVPWVWVWVGGFALRAGWLLAGARRLRQMRRRGVPARLGADIEAQRTALAPRAEFLWSLDVTQPVTFGVRRPAVLLPLRFRDLSAEAQLAVAHHELLHVARRDWIWIVVEEHARAVFWFHPGVWWLVEQVQLAREQVIDRLVVGRASRSAYMSALMTFADRGRLALSNAFFRRRHLQSRFRQLSKEPHMSRRRLAWTAAALAFVMSGAAIGAARAFPLDLQALTQERSGLLEIRLAEMASAPGLTEAVVPDSNQRIYLHAAALATNADVTSANVIDMGGQFGVGVSFGDAATARIREGTDTHLGKPVAIVLDGRVIAAPTLRAPIVRSAVISGSFSAEAATALATRLSPGTVQNVPSPPALAQPAPIRRMIVPYTDEARTVETAGTTRMSVVQRADGSFGDAIVLPVPITRVRPEYTSEARAARIQGTVWLDAVVLRDGSVGDVAVVRSLDSALGLDRQAVEALKQWQWKAATKDGKPEPVSVRVEMTFTLK